ncbi:MAG TPA: sporulation integral membrane protein YlbJ [Acetivibrio sp.]|uniref:sporulation integral membrane protein YlbJ n=1 Tax=Acetivibrio sp. TaxID=1872092 RepID=UPI002B9D3C02|nr:sporulation integral membrane protein YlbJ [Acetivibrio sp.]HOM03618.1 sporulation integral membrane protein YlbJ [Acetivibrio sp.]
MNLYTLSIIALIALVLVINIKKARVIYIKSLMLPAVCVIFILMLIIFSDTAVKSAGSGLSLWLNVVFPSLFPFFAVSEILYRTGFIKAIGILLEPIMRPLFNVPGCGSFAFAMGITSGYPVGAKITASMREEKLLSKTESERLLSFTNNSGPLFIIGAVAVGMFRMPELGLLLLVCHILASITVGILFRFYGRNSREDKAKDGKNLWTRFKKELAYNSRQKLNPGTMLGEAIRNSINVMLSIGGFITLFSVIINILIEIGFISCLSSFISPLLSPFGIKREIVLAVLSGFFEMTTGTSMASKAANTTLQGQLAAVSLLLGWAGLSVHFQVYSIVSRTDISIKPYLFGKMLQGVFAAIYISIAMKLPFTASLTAKSVLNVITPFSDFTWYNALIYSAQNVFASFCILLILTAISLTFHFIRYICKTVLCRSIL